MINLLLPLPMLFAAVILQTPAPVPPPTTAASTTFHSNVLHFDYTYSSTLAAAPSAGDDAIKAEKDKSTGAEKSAINCITLPLTAIDTTAGLRMVLIMRMDGICRGKVTAPSDLGAVTVSAFTESLKRFGTPQLGTPTDYQVAGHSASSLSGSVKSEKYAATFYGIATCLLQGSDVVCWELLTTDCAKLPELMSYPVKFEGHPAEALIPAKFAPPCN
jgi:hypothetical protein